VVPPNPALFNLCVSPPFDFFRTFFFYLRRRSRRISLFSCRFFFSRRRSYLRLTFPNRTASHLPRSPPPPSSRQPQPQRLGFPVLFGPFRTPDPLSLVVYPFFSSPFSSLSSHVLVPFSPRAPPRQVCFPGTPNLVPPPLLLPPQSVLFGPPATAFLKSVSVSFFSLVIPPLFFFPSRAPPFRVTIFSRV